MSLPARIIAGLVALLVAFCAGMKTMAYMRDKAENEKALQAAQAAVTESAKRAKEVARINQEHADEVARISAQRDAALERLRKRPARLPEPARAACQGATGAELSGEDAGVLVREAARADELRGALRACYGWIDSVSGKPSNDSSKAQ